LIIILENAQLETVKVRSILRLGWRILNCKLTRMHSANLWYFFVFDFRWGVLFSS
jgi:hypothetical protein